MTTEIEDGPDWVPLAEVLDELGMTLAEFRVAYPYVGLDHAGFEGETVINRNEL